MSPFAYLPPLTPFLFSALAVSGLASKALHIGLHIESLPFLYFVLYSPTLILPDLLVILLARVLLQFPTPETRLQWVSTGLGGLLALVTWVASSIQFGFFIQTGGEVAWAASSSFMNDPAAMKILLTGISTVSAAAIVLGLIAWLVHAQLYHLTGRGLQAIWDLFTGGYKARYTLLSMPDKSWFASIDLRSVRRIAIIVSVCVSLLFLEASRPSVPYDHLSGALPLTLLDAFTKKSVTDEGCRAPAANFPLWEMTTTAEKWSRPAWLPRDPPTGFGRWDISPQERAERDNISYSICNGAGEDMGFFNPKYDPLKISNLGGEIYKPLQKAFKEHSVEIEHVVLLTLESGRKELFPAQQGTPLFDSLLASHSEKKQKAAIDRLVKMTPVAQMLTAEYATDSRGEKVDLSHARWQDTTEAGMGGLNVRGAVTGSSLTFKSVLGSHCGVYPLPVDLLEETSLEIYQPCLPQLFELFNRGKASLERDVRSTNNQPEAVRNPWKSVFMQSITDNYDRQDILNDQMGFNEKVVKKTLDSHTSKYRAKGQEINYFGYAETELRPYIRDLFWEAANNKTRVFLSHITSTTHHPWGTPDDFEMEKYMGSQGSVNHDSMNNYLNAVRFVDNWLGDIMGMLDDAGIANSTLVVIVGDHGQAFGEDNKDMTGTYENGHISNFRVPLVFRHPHMPRIDITANASSISIIPTILDLLVQSHSLDERDAEIASDLLPEYQGQSLIRPFIPATKPPHRHDEAQSHSAWNFGLINAGGSMISVMAADIPYRLVLPIREGFEYVFTHLGDDPGEQHPTKAWTLSDLVDEVASNYGKEPAAWLEDAEKVGKWWVNEQRRIWGYREA
ncbi:uncharacterized protein N7459_005816 [Penicillium hispanicum]|uniref:uncharacterized protein n=1 Tax=Penicillium hispanicum TaxID=1080232 RepID=UPI0025422500|nr:uncharacterized protein N7459_005816 [Penicillium hispanicum]KAJ5579831.1 hypothetical protein N7459_005816 [Penicillium hispanicum]